MTKHQSSTTSASVVKALYKDPIKISDLQEAILSSETETRGVTPPKDQKMYELVYNYLQVKKGDLTPDQVNSFSATLAWICVGKELSRFLATVPKASLQDLMDAAAKSGLEVETA